MAERVGFEPTIGYSPIHAFQACAFNRSAISPFAEARKFNGYRATDGHAALAKPKCLNLQHKSDAAGVLRRPSLPANHHDAGRDGQCGDQHPQEGSIVHPDSSAAEDV